MVYVFMQLERANSSILMSFIVKEVLGVGLENIEYHARQSITLATQCNHGYTSVVFFVDSKRFLNFLWEVNVLVAHDTRCMRKRSLRQIVH